MDDREFRDAVKIGYSIPESVMLDARGRPWMSRAEWEQLGRWRKLFDRIFGGIPPKPRPRPAWLDEED